MDRNKPGYMNFDDIADRLESGKLNAYDVVYTKDTHEVVFIKEDLSLIRMKCRLDVYPSVVVAEYYLNLNTDTYVGQIVGIEQGEWICLYNVNYADNKFIVRKVGVDEYGQLTNKPQINGVTLEGNKTTEQLGINIPTKFSQLYDDIGYVTFDHLIENYYSKSQTYSKSEVDTALAGKADTGDIPTDLADLQDDSTHRTVTDENIAAWNAKSNVVANPSETTEALNSIEIDGVAYAIAGSGGGAVHSVNGKTGDVELGASDVGALPDDTPLFSGDYNDLENKPTIPSALGDLTDDTYHRTVTDVEKTQWNAAEPNIQSDWNQSDNTKKDYIKNKPNIPAGQIQSDWNQSDNTKADYIKNKPNIPDAQIQSDWNQTDGSSKDYIKNKPALGTASALDVATSGNASANQVVKGNDTRLNDARTPVSHTHTTSEITDFPTLGTAAALDVATTGDASAQQVVRGNDSRLSDARTPLSHTHTLSEITDTGTAAAKDSTSSVTAGSTDLVESGAVKTAIDNAISGAYKHAGTKTCAELISSLLIASNNGNVYNITDNGTTTSDFIEGAGIPIRAGDNVGIAKISDSIYKFDLLSGFIDTSNFITKSSTSGLVKNDGSIDTTEYAPASSVPAAQIQSDWSQSDNTKLDYIKNKPTLGSAAAKNVPSSGDAGNSEVVLGNDSRLTDARNAADVYSWAKAENKPSYTKSEVGLGNVDNTSDNTKKSNFTGSIASGNTGFITGGDVYSALGNKVDKVEGKGLSTEDYSTTEKDKLAGIAEGAEVNVQSDWNQTNTASDDYIKNKPQNLVQDASYVHTDNNFTNALKTKLDGIAEGAEVNVQSDWDEIDDTQDDYIKNKPEAYDAIWQNNNLLSGVSDVQPYLYRATNKPEGAIEYVQEKLIGASAAVNQLIKNGNFESTTDWTPNNTTISASNNILTATSLGFNTNDGIYQNVSNRIISGHKYFIYAYVKVNTSSDTVRMRIVLSNGAAGNEKSYQLTKNTKTLLQVVLDTTDNWTRLYLIGAYSGSGIVANDTIEISNFNCIDLTQMFGTAIADLAYSKEQASAGSGIAWFKSYGFFTKDYYPYNAGALQSVKTGSKKVTGKNLAELLLSELKTGNPSGTWNDNIYTFNNCNYEVDKNDNNLIKIYGTPSGNAWLNLKSIYIYGLTSITVSGLEETSGLIWNGIVLQDDNKVDLIDLKPSSTYKNAVTIDLTQYPNARYLALSVKRYMNDTALSGTIKLQLELGSTATSYEPYTSTTYPLDSDLELRGLYKLDASNNIVCDGDEYTPDGSVKRRYGILDLGSLEWQKGTSGGTVDYFYLTNVTAQLPNLKQETFPTSTNIVCPKYVAKSNNNSIAVALSEDMQMCRNQGNICIRNDSYTDATAFKTAMSGVYLIYELATPTTDSADSYQNPQIIHENGTEEFIDTRDYPLPVGHDTGYFTASDEKFFLPPVVDNDGRILYHDKDGFQFKKYTATDNNFTDALKAKLDGISAGANKVESSETNGNIVVDGTEVTVYDDTEIKADIDAIDDIISTDEVTKEGNPLNFTTLSAQTAKSTILSVEPIQDLHGYDKPWVGGANVNKCDAEDITKTSSGYIIGLNGGKDWVNENHDTFSAGTYTLSFYVSDFTNNSATQLSLYNNDTTVITKAVNNISGRNIITVSPESDFNKIALYTNSVAGGKFIKIQFESGEQASDYRPYKNICPISGRSEIGILGCGKNLLPLTVEGIKANNTTGTWSGNAYTINNGTITLETDSDSNIISIKANGTFNADTYFKLASFPFTKNNYIINGSINGSLQTYFLNVAGTVNQYNDDVTVNANTTKIVYIGIASSANLSNVKFYPMIRLAQVTDNTFEPYTKSNDLTISLGQTVYGGTLDVENGTLVVDRKGIDMGDLSWTYHSPSGIYTAFFDTYLPNDSIVGDGRVAANIISPLYETIPSGIIATEGHDNGVQALAFSTRRFITCDKRYSDATSYTEAVDGQIVVYELATPITINLTPHTINLLKGVNNISTDGDKITLTYRDGSVATLGDLTSAVDNLDSKIDESKILTDTATGDKYILVVTNGVLSVQQISN